MKEKYLVIADTYGGGYGVELTLFGVFDTESEAIKFIMDNPTIKYKGPLSTNGEEATFNFFKNYEKHKIEKIYAQDTAFCLKPRICVGEHTISKEEYALKHYIEKFSGAPLFIGGYTE